MNASGCMPHVDEFDQAVCDHPLRDGKPLYFFAGDAELGGAKGDGMNGVWHVVKRGAARAAASTHDSSYYYK